MRFPPRLAFAGSLLAAALLAPAAPAAMSTPWTAKVDRAAPWPDYPRPQFQRDTWVNLNGAWDYAIRPRDLRATPAAFDGKILVPFPIESDLSGVKRRVAAGERVWYRRTFTAPDLAGGKRLLLNFGAVDWQAEVFVNGQALGRHEGGYDPFSFDITGVVQRGGGPQELVVAVWDPTDEGSQPRGKQVQKPGGIWYTPVTGIWQTVWLEAVPGPRVSGLTLTPDFDRGSVTVLLDTAGSRTDARTEITVLAGGQKVASATPADPGAPVVLALPQPHAWSPDDPFLYDVDVTYRVGGNVDHVRSYFGLRKVEVRRAADGFDRIFLNNQPTFLIGPLDQGWWPDGLYTAPTDEALRWDVETMRHMGFNVARKHVKVEPARWYYHCDQLGLMVWQDLPSAMRAGVPGHRVAGNQVIDGVFSPEDDAQVRRELKALVDNFKFFPCIVAWVPFNEGWGQHNTNDILAWTKRLDPTRLVDGPSGWTDLGFGDLLDKHDYPGPGMFPAQGGRASVLGEFGGLGLPIEGHLWQQDKNWGYRSMKDRDELGDRYAALIANLPALIKHGLAAAIYTQITDVEVEVNGLVTYDRQVVKIPAERLAALHREIINPKKK
jgi:beta-galactosidase/beta-glucuronidase